MIPTLEARTVTIQTVTDDVPDANKASLCTRDPHYLETAHTVEPRFCDV
jgi:hypothetical protein